MAASSFLFLGAMTWEYLEANKAGDKAQQSEDIEDITKQRDIFDEHQRNQRYYGYALLGVYSWHILDLVFFGKKTDAAVHQKNPYRTVHAAFFPLFQRDSQEPALGF